ncbi:SRPBCC family protein [Nonomuraea sp. NPDC050556]|uniref:SRPBCC family protein n=1 Tax=Nonomuraea sp. NPDC050556 TaxID=3364369 RepID=UPI0037916F83
MTRFEVRTHIAAQPEQVFKASLSVEAHTESMGKTAERAVGGVTYGHMTLNDQVTWRARHFGVYWHMTSTISACEPPSFFVDEQVKGPFRRWRHEHYFADDGNGGTTMHDIVAFTAPAGVLGRIAERLILKRYMTKLIETRNQYLKHTTEAAFNAQSPRSS